MFRHTTIVALFAVVVVAVVSGQSQRSPATLDDLLSELHGLRADLNASTGTTTRAQVIVGDSRCRSSDLRYRENELLNMLVTEQGRWIELSSRLDGRAGIDTMKTGPACVAVPPGPRDQ